MIPVSEKEANTEKDYFCNCRFEKPLQSLLRENPETWDSKIEENEIL